jgi:Ferritin-like domain
MAVGKVTPEMIDSVVNRRSFLTGVGAVSIGAAAAAIIGCGNNGSGMMKVSAATTTDTATQIFTAALIAEDLAITTYYNALIGAVIQDPNLAGPGGTATNVSASGSQVNVAYLQGALLEEVQHAQLLRTLLGLSNTGSGDVAAGVPATFYYPTGTFSTLANFLPVLLALETAFVGAYMTAVEEFASMAAGYNGFSATQANPAMSGSNYTQADLILYAKVAASILGVESEHRALIRAIPSVTIASPTFAATNLIPANNVNYESQAGLTGLIVGVDGTTTTAASALAPFLASSSAQSAGFSFSTANTSYNSVITAGVTTSGSIPTAE